MPRPVGGITWARPSAPAGEPASGSKKLVSLRESGPRSLCAWTSSAAASSSGAVSGSGASGRVSLASAPGWLWGQASKAGSFAYNPDGYPDIYCLVDKDGILRDVALAPNVTMEKIMAFATSSPGDEGS